MASLFGRAVLLLGLGAILGILINMARPDGVRFAVAPALAATSCSVAPGPATKVAAAPGAVTTSDLPPVEILPPAQAVSLCGDPNTLVADVRDADDFAHGHVSGAIHLPCAAPGSAASAAVELLGGRRTLIVYGNRTDDAALVADEMRNRAARPDMRVVVLAGGFPAWSLAGLACSSGPCPDCQVPPGRP